LECGCIEDIAKLWGGRIVVHTICTNSLYLWLTNGIVSRN
jgi:hypothetical protein